VAIVVSRYNEGLTRALLSGALQTLLAAGIQDENVAIVWSPGAFELPLLAQRLAEMGDYQAVICLGAVIRGDTTHDQHINRAVSMGIMDGSLATGIPILFGVLTCDSLEQAWQRAGGTAGNKGAEAATAALEIVSQLEQIEALDLTPSREERA
jgi:6,7-dimethyl-8-ribityllumazine synthase